MASVQKAAILSRYMVPRIITMRIRILTTIGFFPTEES